jgi:hypothetical protein
VDSRFYLTLGQKKLMASILDTAADEAGFPAHYFASLGRVVMC